MIYRAPTEKDDTNKSREIKRAQRAGRTEIYCGASEIGGDARAGEEIVAGRRADELDEQAGGGDSGFCGARERCPFYGCGRARVRDIVPGRYGPDDLAFARY